MTIAAGVNGVVVYLFKMGEVKVGLLQGAVTALVLNLVHHISHRFPGDENEELGAVVSLIAIFMGSIYFFPNIAKQFGKETTFYQSLKYGIISCLSIILCNRFYHK